MTYARRPFEEVPMLPLQGVTVVSLEQAVAAPFATRQLADLGARVIKVERPEGDFARGYDTAVLGLSSHFVWLNRGKESVVLDIKDPGDREILDAMLAEADVFVQNLAPGAVHRLGLDAATLRAGHPRLITCTISGYGLDGPYRGKKAYDLLVQCEAGLLSVTGTPGSPAKAGIAVADIAAGTYACGGILTALYERERTGDGTDLDVTMLDALGEWMTFPYLFAHYGGTPPPRSGARHASIAPYGPYRAGDGAQVFIGVQNEREWAALCARVLGRPGLADDPRFADNPRRVENAGELTPLIEAALAPLTAREVEEQLDQAGIANARMRTMEEFAAHPQLASRNRWRDVATPGGAVRSLLPPVTVAGREAAMGAVPGVGEHTAAIRAEFGGGPDGASAATRPETVTRTELITREPAEALAGLLDLDPPSPGEPLPPLWHWIYLLERRAQRELGPDGHPTEGIPTPPGPGRLRMFAGGRVTMYRPLRFGAHATRTTWVANTAEKAGRSGPLTFVTVRTEIEQGGVLAIADEQDIVYREPGSSAAPGRTGDPREEAAGPGVLEFDVDPLVLFRFSALTYNAHRIHYDRDYAVAEGYPDLVVHGPLQALLMGELLRRSGALTPSATFSYRLVAPAFGAQRLTVSPGGEGPGASARVRDSAGRTTATSTVTGS
ncbi:MAG: CoA transferase [Actinoallomurus sp.]